MLIQLDPRAGSGDLKPLLEGRVSLLFKQMDYADAAFDGFGPKGPVRVGVEIKKLDDILGSLTDERFTGHQLPGLLADYQVVYLLIEGTWRQGVQGQIQQLKLIKFIGGEKQQWCDARTRLTWSAFSRWRQTLTWKCGVHFAYTNNRTETAQLLIDLAAWWAKPWSKHKAHQAFDPQVHLNPRRLLLVKPGMVGRMIKELPGIGFEKHRAVVRHFGTVYNAVTAPQAEWEKIQGIGKLMAERIFKALRSKC